MPPVGSSTSVGSIGSHLRSAAQDAYLRRGSRGDAVRELQQALNARGARLEVDGDFGPRTEAAVRDFQRRTGAAVDGVVGPQTLSKLASTPPGPTPPRDDYRPPTTGPVTLPSTNGTARERWEMYASMVRRAGGEVCPNGQPTVLGLRSGPGASTRQYDDRFVVLTPDGRVHELRGATHPGQASSSLSPDVTGDGVGDVGMIRPGNYSVAPNGLYKGSPSFHVRTTGGSGAISGVRDTNHDGRFSDSERSASERRGDRLTGVLFHPGNANAPRSIGCLTLPPAEFNRFLQAVGGSRASFSFTLVEV